MCMNHIHLENASSSFSFFSPFYLPPSRLPLPFAPSPSSPPSLLPIVPILSPPPHPTPSCPPSCLPFSFPLLALASSSPPSPPPPHLPISVSPISPSQSPPPHCPLPIAPPRLPAPLLPVHPPLDHYLLLNQDMLQLLLSFCSIAHLRWRLRPTPPSPHSSSDDFTSILQISAR